MAKKVKPKKQNCGGKSCGWTGDECTCNLGRDDTNNEWIIDDVIHGLEALNFNSEEARNVVKKALSSERKKLKKEIDFMSVDIRNEAGDEYIKKSDILKLL